MDSVTSVDKKTTERNVMNDDVLSASRVYPLKKSLVDRIKSTESKDDTNVADRLRTTIYIHLTDYKINNNLPSFT